MSFLWVVWLATLSWNQGCLQVSTFNPKMGHEANCKFWPYSCPYPDKGCDWEGSLDQNKLHLIQEHKLTPRIARYACTFCVGDISLPWVWVAIKSYWGKQIALSEWQQYPHLFDFVVIVKISFGLWSLNQIIFLKLKKTKKGIVSQRPSFKNETSKGLKVVWVLHL